MIFQSTLLVVSDMEKSKEFYSKFLGQKITADLGANVIFGNFCLQTKESWCEFISCPASEIGMRSKNAELYFAEKNFDAFLDRLKKSGAELVAPPLEHRWGQRVVRFFDPDGHIIEVGEPLEEVALRFAKSGMGAKEISVRMDYPLDEIKKWVE